VLDRYGIRYGSPEIEPLFNEDKLYDPRFPFIGETLMGWRGNEGGACMTH
jgi:hypothetical protein